MARLAPTAEEEEPGGQGVQLVMVALALTSTCAKKPAPHGVQVRAAWEVLPGGQHAPDPSALKLPGQPVHLLWQYELPTVKKVAASPGGQGVHTLPLVFENMPVGQGVQDEAPETEEVPGEQGEQFGHPLPVQIVPGVQGRQTLAPEELNLPTPQGVHWVEVIEPTSVPKEPGLHGVHEVAPLAG